MNTYNKSPINILANKKFKFVLNLPISIFIIFVLLLVIRSNMKIISGNINKFVILLKSLKYLNIINDTKQIIVNVTII